MARKAKQKLLFCASCHQRTLVKDLTKKRPWYVCQNLLCPAKQKQLQRLGSVIVI